MLAITQLIFVVTRQALTNVYNLLKPSGTALLLFLVKNPVYDIYEGLQKLEKYEKYTRDAKNFISPYHHEPEAEKLFRRYISDIGFKPIHIELKDRMFVFETTYQFYSKYFKIKIIKLMFYLTT